MFLKTMFLVNLSSFVHHEITAVKCGCSKKILDKMINGYFDSINQEKLLCVRKWKKNKDYITKKKLGIINTLTKIPAFFTILVKEDIERHCWKR